jgi:hypothetical protein
MNRRKLFFGPQLERPSTCWGIATGPFDTITSWSRERQVAHSFIFSIRKREPPTLWPLPPREWTPMEFAIEVFEEENRLLKIMVVSLSKLILGTMPDHKWLGMARSSESQDPQTAVGPWSQLPPF